MARSFTDNLVASARIYAKGNTQSHEQIAGLKRSIDKIERRMKIASSKGDMVQVMKLADLLKTQAAALQREVDRFKAEGDRAAKRQGKKPEPRVLPRLDAPSRDQKQFEESNGSRRIRVKAVSKKV